MIVAHSTTPKICFLLFTTIKEFKILPADIKSKVKL